MRIPLLCLAIASVFNFSSALASDIPTDTLMEYLDAAQGKVSNQALPMGRVMVSTRGNTHVIMSDNGRYKFTGPIVDTWLGVEIQTFEDARYSAEHLSLQNLKFKAEYLEPLNYGGGSQTAMVFLSPDDLQSRQLIDAAKSLQDEYTFQFIVVPSKETPLGIAHAFACPQDPAKALSVLLAGTDASELKAKDGCNYDKLSNRILAVNMLGFDDLPAVMSPSSKLAVGTPSDGKSWNQFLMENTL